MPRGTTTEWGVCLDVIAALDMYTGDVGDDGVQIEDVSQDDPTRPRVITLTLTNGDKYDLTVEERVIPL